MILDAKCKKCRRVGQKLFLKGERCFTVKCAMVKKPYPPGPHGKKGKRGISEYGKQLLEKQRIRQTYNVLERQFRKYIQAIMSIRQSADRRELLWQKLEKRLDNVVFRLGWAKSRLQARQITSHRHILVNGRVVNIPSYEMKINDILTVSAKSRQLNIFENSKSGSKKSSVPPWLNLSENGFEAKIVSTPTAEDARELESLGVIIEYYSR